jgi:heptosyltransferase-2
MRILIVTDGYPPVDLGARDLGCRDIVESFKARGHDVCVLAGRPPKKAAQGGGDVLRWMIRDRQDISNWPAFFRKEAGNQGALRIVCREFKPQAALFFDHWNMSASLPLLAEKLGCPACLHVEGDGLATWESDPWFREQPQGNNGRKVIRHLARKFDLAGFPRSLHELPVVFTSRYFREVTEGTGNRSPRAFVIPWGVDTRRFPFRENGGSGAGRLLYYGPLVPQRGLEAAIDSLGILNRDNRRTPIVLTIAGSVPGAPDYVASLQERAAAAGVAESLSFVGFSPDRSSPDLYLAHDFFLFPSARVEPLSLPLLEAMACGLSIVAAASGGNAELLEHEVNALVVSPENPEALAQAVKRLLGDPALAKSLRLRARQVIEERFRLDRSVEALESVLKDIAAPAPAAESPRLSARVSSPPPKISAQMDRWFRRGNQLVRIKHLFKPKSFAAKLGAKRKNASARICLRLYPPLLKWVTRKSRRGRPGSDQASGLREILVVQLADLGDIILSGPFLRDLRAFAPESKIVLAVHPGMVDVVSACPHVDEVISFPFRACPYWKYSFNGNSAWWRKSYGLARRVFAKRHFDLAVSLRWNDDATQAASLILMTASGAPCRAAYLNPPDIQKLKGKNTVSRLITEGPYRGPARHEIEYQADILRSLGGRPAEPRLEVWTTPDDERKANELLAGAGHASGETLIALAPGAAWEYRRWPADRFVAVGRWLQETYGARILILAGKAEEAVAGEIEKGLLPGRTVNLAGRTTIREMAAVLKSCRYFLGNDSGPMHVAVAAGVSVVGLFGPGDYVRFRPWGPGHAVVHLGLTCNPCSENCLFSEARCIRGISVDQAKSALKNLLGPGPSG